MQNKGEILAEILSSYSDCYIFLHNTKKESVARNIFENGFIYESQLSNTTDRVNPLEPIEISYFFFQRKDYGEYTVIIAINKSVYDLYLLISKKKGITLEEVMSAHKPYFSENDELVFNLPPEHILGYFNGFENRLIKNPGWDPGFTNIKQSSSKK
jgi:hypothetical protein